MQFRYVLDDSSKKYTCKKCLKKSMVRFINTENNELMPLEFGRCDRESKCGFFNSPQNNSVKNKTYVLVTPKPASYLDLKLISNSGRRYKHNNFIQFLKSIFSETEVKEIIKKYLIGTSKRWNGATVFWQLDDQLKLRHGKVMLYDSISGKRVKDSNGKSYIDSVRSILKLENFNLKQSLFGLHLVLEESKKIIAIVESEKTAILMSIYKPNYLWMASGSKNGFKYEMLKPIKKHQIVAFPDKSEYNDWLNKGLELNDLGFNIKVSSLVEEIDLPKGTDLADIYLQNLISTNKHSIQKIKVDADKTKNHNQVIMNNTELKIQKMVAKNPALIKLINSFDLTDKNGNAINQVIRN
jgi:hypothetical protein